jgi:hypothetical protein
MQFVPMAVGWVLAAWWARWLAARGAGDVYAQVVTWGGAGALVFGQAMAAYALAVGGPTAADQIRMAVNLGQGAVVLSLICDAAMTVRWAMRRPA